MKRKSRFGKVYYIVEGCPMLQGPIQTATDSCIWHQISVTILRKIESKTFQGNGLITGSDDPEPSDNWQLRGSCLFWWAGTSRPNCKLERPCRKYGSFDPSFSTSVAIRQGSMKGVIQDCVLSVMILHRSKGRMTEGPITWYGERIPRSSRPSARWIRGRAASHRVRLAYSRASLEDEITFSQCR